MTDPVDVALQYPFLAVPNTMRKIATENNTINHRVDLWSSVMNVQNNETALSSRCVAYLLKLRWAGRVVVFMVPCHVLTKPGNSRIFRQQQFCNTGFHQNNLRYSFYDLRTEAVKYVDYPNNWCKCSDSGLGFRLKTEYSDK